MRIAVVGSGIAGLASAWLLSREHQVTLFEAGSRLGGHTHTHSVPVQGKTYEVDSGFIVMNAGHYPLFSRFLNELKVATQPTVMSFGVHEATTGYEYNATSVPTLFCQKRNIMSPAHWLMIRDIFRFYREAPALLHWPDAGPSLGEYLERGRYSKAFRDRHLIPMASALWSSPATQILDFPARYLVQFMANHQMLSTSDRPTWQVVKGGSSRYIDALTLSWSVAVRLNAPVLNVQRTDTGVSVKTGTDEALFDQVVLACHSDQALALLAAPSDTERAVLSAIRYQVNDTVLHTDQRLLPKRRTAWAAWNALIFPEPEQPCTVTYHMNQLQSLDAPVPFCVTLNCTDRIDPDKIIARMRYEHPIYTHDAVAAQSRRDQINGKDRIWFAGAYWGWGFHEDGMRSAVDVARGLGVRWP
ncbi:dehydrogenase [Ahniella affigens]|uniref:Dehydrogenase n=1 Tax=Ahniella affigens TaxID=2021234 RepID=A0A2P1PS81_9GAMM|nr:FAD-dependent oxidoreductase [Ahniella affigens]AVP97685.1 dehydrogenase [Ahniella affigens]